MQIKNDWLEVPESEWLLQEARVRYPVGTRFKSAYSGNEYMSSGYFMRGDKLNIYVQTDMKPFVYYNGKWAEIISKPEQNMELKITKERVLSAAEKCSMAKETLKELFPEVFEESYAKKLAVFSPGCILEPLERVVCNIHLCKVRDRIPGTKYSDKAESIAKLKRSLLGMNTMPHGSTFLTN